MTLRSQLKIVFIAHAYFLLLLNAYYLGNFNGTKVIKLQKPLSDAGEIGISGFIIGTEFDAKFVRDLRNNSEWFLRMNVYRHENSHYLRLANSMTENQQKPVISLDDTGLHDFRLFWKNNTYTVKYRMLTEFYKPPVEYSGITAELPIDKIKYIVVNSHMWLAQFFSLPGQPLGNTLYVNNFDVGSRIYIQMVQHGAIMRAKIEGDGILFMGLTFYMGGKYVGMYNNYTHVRVVIPYSEKYTKFTKGQPDYEILTSATKSEFDKNYDVALMVRLEIVIICRRKDFEVHIKPLDLHGTFPIIEDPKKIKQIMVSGKGAVAALSVFNH